MPGGRREVLLKGMAAQVEVQPGEVGRTSVGGRLHLSPLADSSNKSLIEGSSNTQGSLIITPEPSKPPPGPKPRLTPKPYAVEKNPTIRPILAPKPHTKPRPEPTRPTAYKPDPPSAPKPQQPNVTTTSKHRPVSTNPCRPAPTSYKPSPKLSTGQTTKLIVQPFKPAPPLTIGEPSKPTPPQPVERQKSGAAGWSQPRGPRKPPAAEWSGSTKQEVERDKTASSHRTGGASMTRAKSMGFLSQIGQEEEEKEKEEEERPEGTVTLRAQSKGSRPRPVSAIFMPSPSQADSPTLASRWAGRRPLSADLTSKFESIGLSLHRRPAKADSKENTPEEGVPPRRKEREKGPEGALAPPQQGPDTKPLPPARGIEKKKEEEKDEEKDEEKGGGSIKRRISLLLDSSFSPAGRVAAQGPEPRSPVQPIPESDLLGVKQRIKKLTEDTPPAQTPAVKTSFKPRPLPLDLTKRFAPEGSTDLSSPSPNEATDRHESDFDPQRRVEEDSRGLQEQPIQPPSGPSVVRLVESEALESSPSIGVQTVRAAVFENVVERHSVLVMEDDRAQDMSKAMPRRSLSLRRGDVEDDGNLVTATYRQPASPSSPRRVEHSFDTVQAVGERRAVSESVPSAQHEDKAMTLRSRRSDWNKPARGEPAEGRPTQVEGEFRLPQREAPATQQEHGPRYLRVGSLQKWNTADVEREADVEKGRQREREMEKERQLVAEREKEIKEEEKERQKEAERRMQMDVDRDKHREPEREREEVAAPKRLKMLEVDEQPPKPRATYFALTGQIQEPTSHGEEGAERGNMEVPFDDFSVRSGQWSSQGKVLPLRRNPSLDEAFGKRPQGREQGNEMMERSTGVQERERGMAWGKQAGIEEMEIEKRKQMDFEKLRGLEIEREQQGERNREMEREKQRQLELERHKQLEFARMREREKQRELERERQKEMEKERLRELERERQKELERERLRELERERQKELERERQRELERKRKQELERERQRELEIKRQRELERARQQDLERERQRELEIQNEERLRQKLELQRERQRGEELERIKEMERRQLFEFEKQKQIERERQQRLEHEKQRLREKMERDEQEKMRQMAIQQEVDRQRELDRERERLRELERERVKELERERQRDFERQRDLERQRDMERQRDLERQRQRDLERERQKQLDFERQELENQRVRQRESENERQRAEELDRIKEMERRQLFEFEKQKQVERERQQILEVEKHRLMERDEQEKMRQVARQQELERQRLKEKQRREDQERGALDSSPLRPKVLDLDSVSRGDQFSRATPHTSARWKQPSPRSEEHYRPAILDIDSFRSQTQSSPTREVFPTAGVQGVNQGSGVRSHPHTPEREGSHRMVPEGAVGRPSPVWASSQQELWDQRQGEAALERPLAGPEPPRKPANKPSLEQLLFRMEERATAPSLIPERRWSGVPNEPSPSGPFPRREPNAPGSPVRGPTSTTTPMELIWFSQDSEPLVPRVEARGQRRSQGSQDLSRMRSRSVSRRSALSESSVDGSLSRMRSRSAHRERDRQSWEQLKQSVEGEQEQEGRDADALLHEADSQYGTWETGLRTDDSLTPATPTSDSNLSPSPRKPTPPHTPGEHAPPGNLDTPDGLSPMAQSEIQPLPFPEAPIVRLDSSALRSRAQLSKQRGPRSRPTRAARQSAALSAHPEGQAEPAVDWRSRDSTEDKVDSPKQEDSDSEEQYRGGDPRSAASQPQRVPLFPGMDPSALKAQLKKRGDSDNQTDGPVPSPSQLSRSPKSPFLPRASRVLPPTGGKENGEEASPQWLRELKSKKRFSQYENDS